jgi:hypothetical protein
VVPSSSAKAVRLIPGGTCTNVPAGASSLDPSSSNRACPEATKYSSSLELGSASSCSLITRLPAFDAVDAMIPKVWIPKWWRTGRNGSRPSSISSISLSCAIP